MATNIKLDSIVPAANGETDSSSNERMQFDPVKRKMHIRLD